MSSAARATILLVDDSPDTHAHVRACLRASTLKLKHAFGAHEALLLALEQPPDLALLDVETCTRGSLDLVRELSRDPCTAGAPILFLADEGTTPNACGFADGPQEHLTKPLDPDELTKRINAALAVKSGRDVLLQHSGTDPLTHRPLRGKLEDLLFGKIAQVERGGRAPAVAILDIKGFRNFNHRRGHAAGDAVLAGAAAFLTEHIRAERVFRLDGDRFALLLGKGGADVADRARTLLAAHLHRLTERTGSLGCTAGAALWSAPTSAVGLVRAAQQALAMAKAAGGNRLVATGWARAAGPPSSSRNRSVEVDGPPSSEVDAAPG